jgi:FixJ family two-component response regulator
MVHFSGMIFAVVDDDIDVRTALNRLLRAMGHEVHLFAAAEEFVADRPDVDCLILDIRLPGLNGLELREQMHSAGRLLPLVFITGDGDRFFGDVGATDIPTLHKPFDEDSLVAAIDNVVVAASHRGR